MMVLVQYQTCMQGNFSVKIRINPLVAVLVPVVLNFCLLMLLMSTTKREKYIRSVLNKILVDQHFQNNEFNGQRIVEKKARNFMRKVKDTEH